jgi:hypothetical protein
MYVCHCYETVCIHSFVPLREGCNVVLLEQIHYEIKQSGMG